MPNKGRLQNRCARAGHAIVVSALVLSSLAVLGATTAAPVAADIGAELAEPSLGHVTSDALPTVQINGVVWDQTIIGSTVYAVGEFSSARPAGDPAGTNETPRSNILAYDLTTGELIHTFAPSLNAEGTTVTASPDGSRLFIGGSFTQVNGVSQYRIAALNPNSGELIAGFNATVDYHVNDLVATDSQLFAAGAFNYAGAGLTAARSRLAAFSASNGALISGWAPVADNSVMALVIAPDGTKIFAGGRFTTMNGSAAKGLAAIDIQTGAVTPWAANTVVKNGGASAAILSLTTDGTSIFGGGYTYGRADGNLEGSFSANPTTGEMNWVADCHGDIYDTVPLNGYLYTASHAHYCGNVNGFPQTDPWTINQRHLNSFETTASSTLKREPWRYNNWEGTPAPRMAAWFPDWEVGTYTGVNQAAWTVEGTANYLVAGGEFLRVNGQPQEGLVRFAVRPIAPATDGPRLGGSEFLPTVRSGSAGRVRVSFPSNWDRDSKRLTYRIVRDNANANPIFEKSSESAFWDRPIIAFTDSGLVPGSTHTYKVRTEDPDNNVTWSDSVSVTVATTGSASPYADAVMADGARMHWRLGETVGSSTLANELSPETLTATGPALGSAGAMLNETNTSATFSNSVTSQFYDPNRSTAQDPLSIEAWVKTRTKSGGRIMGFGDNATGTSSKFDRLLYMANDGRVIFGVNQTDSGAGPKASSTKQTVQSVAGFNNNQWHHVVGTLGEDGMHLFVDGVRVGSLGDVRRGQAFYGYWRIGADTLSDWPSRPTRDYLTGQIDEPAVYHKVLTPASVAAHYKASGRTPAIAPTPADSYGAATQAADPYLYYRLADTSGTDAVDSGIRANTGDYVGSATRNVAGVISGNAAVQFGGASFIASRTAIYNPTNYSAEIWFNTTTALGGKLIGFGNARTDNSTTYDRHIYMQDDGKVVFGVKTGAANSVVSAQSYNNGLWHHAVATQGPDGMDLYVDGQRVGSNPQKLATPFTGYWRIGGDTTGGASTNSNFVGNLDEAAVYNAVLSPSDVLANYSRGGGLLANTGPTAAFTASTSFDDLVADASASTDLDGSILSYEWDFGDSSTGTGITATHRYATAGAYTVTLKVTDDDGATNQTTRQITTVLNQRPTASFLRSSTSLVTTTNALASTDSDGSIVNYAWEFGDGSTGTGVTATHAYATAGTYTITLTVTDDHGATGVLSRLVTVAGAAVYASDAFERTLVNSFGTADTGGTWTNTGTAAWYSVNNGTGKHLLNAAGRTTASYLNSVSATDVSATVDLSFGKAPTGGGFYSSLAVRRIGTSEYRVRAKALPTSTSLTLSRIVSGTETTISAITLPGLIYTPGDTWRIKLEATGTGTTTLTAKLWNITQPEPLTAQLTSTDTTPSLQSPGGIGVINYLAGSVTNVPITVTYNNLLVVPKN